MECLYAPCRTFAQTILNSYYKGGPVGLGALAASLNEEPDTIVDVVEPFLLKIGYLKRTPRGREVTELGYKHLNRPHKGQKEFL